MSANEPRRSLMGAGIQGFLGTVRVKFDGFAKIAGDVLDNEPSLYELKILRETLDTIQNTIDDALTKID